MSVDGVLDNSGGVRPGCTTAAVVSCTCGTLNDGIAIAVQVFDDGLDAVGLVARLNDHGDPLCS